MLGFSTSSVLPTSHANADSDTDVAFIRLAGSARCLVVKVVPVQLSRCLIVALVVPGADRAAASSPICLHRAIFCFARPAISLELRQPAMQKCNCNCNNCNCRATQATQGAHLHHCIDSYIIQDDVLGHNLFLSPWVSGETSWSRTEGGR